MIKTYGQSIKNYRTDWMSFYSTTGVQGDWRVLKATTHPATYSPQNLQSYLNGYDFDKGLEVTWPILVLVVAERDKWSLLSTRSAINVSF